MCTPPHDGFCGYRCRSPTVLVEYAYTSGLGRFGRGVREGGFGGNQQGEVDRQHGQIRSQRGGCGGRAEESVQPVGGQVLARLIPPRLAFLPRHVLGSQRRVGPLHQLRLHRAYTSQA